MKQIDSPKDETFDLRSESIMVMKSCDGGRKLYDLVETDIEEISLLDISQTFGDKGTLLVIVETPLDGTIYRYNNYDTKEWVEVGKMCGYA